MVTSTTDSLKHKTGNFGLNMYKYMNDVDNTMSIDPISIVAAKGLRSVNLFKQKKKDSSVN